MPGPAVPVAAAAALAALCYLLYLRHHAAAAGRDARLLFQESPVALCLLTADSRILRANAAMERMLGCAAAELQGRNLGDILHAEDLDSHGAHLLELFDNYSDVYRVERRFIHAAGRVLWARLSLYALRDGERRITGFVAAAEDIGEQKRTERINRAAEDKLRAIVDHLPTAVWMTTSDASRVLFVNEAYEVIWGQPKEHLYADPGTRQSLIHPEDSERVTQSLAARGSSNSYEINYRILRDDGEVRYVRETGKSVYDAQGYLQRWVASATDISSEMYVRDELHELNSRLREANLRLREHARLDSLTQCLNRSAFFGEAEKALQLEQRYGRSSTLVFFDLNNFKEVNDNFGHHVGDRALVDFAEHIKQRLRTTDELGRYGGDEFVALLRETDTDQARQLLASLTPAVVDAGDGSSVILRFSAGVACSNDEGITTVDDWMRVADQHMYRHKVRRKH